MEEALAGALETELRQPTAISGEIGGRSDMDTNPSTLGLPGKKEGGHDSPPKGYPKDKGKYADPKNYRYPIDTEEHVRAALSYIGQKKNEHGYSSSELASVKGRIHRAAKKFGIEVEQ